MGNAGFDSNIGNVLREGQLFFRDNLRTYISQYPSNAGLLGNIQAIFTDNLTNVDFVGQE